MVGTMVGGALKFWLRAGIGAGLCAVLAMTANPAQAQLGDILTAPKTLIDRAIDRRLRRGESLDDPAVRARVYREKQDIGLQGLVELFARDPRLHRHCQIRVVDGQHLVHASHVHADAALHRQQMPLQRGAHTKRDHRHGVARGVGDPSTPYPDRQRGPASGSARHHVARPRRCPDSPP